jgi:hypothetical protein
MSNDEVIENLEKVLIELEDRRGEVESQLDRTDIPLTEWYDFEKLINARVSSLTIRIVNTGTRLRERRLLRGLGRAVSPLNASSVSALKAALEKVQQSIVATAAVKNVLRLASEISDAATTAFIVSAPEVASA